MDMKQPQMFAKLETWLNDRHVTEIECLVPDLTGVARSKILPREKFTEDRGMRLPEVVVAGSVTSQFPTEGPLLRSGRTACSVTRSLMHWVIKPFTSFRASSRGDSGLIIGS